ncbi:hypothetical protein ENUP19_0374G0002 [Entamoeba nuttalli]|uniref:Activator 1 subunit n=1 Tax=Entamoeba nuttalli TaxID=412467 RepID=A0ABQ0DZ10_9EUKA
MFNKRPNSFNELDHANEANELLINLSKNKDMPHLLFHGPEGSGKYTRALLYLKNIYGDGVMKIEPSTTVIDVKGKPKEINLRSSPYHVELIPSNATESDKLVIQEYVKSLTTFQTLSSLIQQKSTNRLILSSNSEPKQCLKEKQTKFRVIMIFDADHLTNEAQQSLRRTMETGSEVCRFILFCTNPCSVIQPIRSRCVMIRVPLPNKQQMTKIVEKLGGNEKIVGISRGNILLAEAAAFEYRLTGKIENLYWREKLAEIVIGMKKISSKEFEKKRDEIVELSTIISADTILKTMFWYLMESKIDPKYKIEIPSIAMKHSHNMSLGTEPIYHIEAFMLEISSLLNN